MYILNYIILTMCLIAGNTLNQCKNKNKEEPTQVNNLPIETKKILSKRESISTVNTTDYRLPTRVTPKEYHLYLQPFIIPENFTFNGKVNIVCYVNETTSLIVMHANKITINSVIVFKITNNDKVELDIKSTSSSDKYQFFYITMKSVINAGSNINIEIVYKGILNMDMVGFYRSSYRVQKEIRWLVGTQLEPTGARMLLPCFDEPALKAVFHVTVTAPDNYTVLSNMPVKTIKQKNIYEFEKTPPMSTYLLAIVVSNFKSLSTKKSNLTFAAWSNPKLTNQLTYGLSLMPKMIDYFEKKFSIPYSLPKLDMVAMPDFSAGAMENWGLLLYREATMLYDEKFTPITTKRRVHCVVTHEITHQWIGNLVSPKWWDYTWLNEAFAAYFEYHAHEKAIDDWKLETEFVVNSIHRSLNSDALAKSHPLTNKVYNNNEIESTFDSITYKKGASLIRMLEKLLGQELFFGALRRYLKANAYSVGTPELLFTAIEDEIQSNNYKLNVTVSEFMNTWTLQSGYPVIDVRSSGDNLTLKQKRFSLETKKRADDNATWIVPINWATETKPNFNDTRTIIWLTKPKTITLKNASKDWVIINVQQIGFYRVNYDKKMWDRIIKCLKSNDYEIIHEINRASLIDDLFNLARVGLVDYNLLMSMTQYLVQETYYVPWNAALTGFSYLKREFLGNPKIYTALKVYILSILEPNYRRLGFNEKPGEKDFDVILRQMTLTWLCDFNHEECIEKSLEIFKQHKEKRGYPVVPPNQQSFIYCSAIKNGTNDDWNYLWEKFEETDFSFEKLIILSGLSCSKNESNLQRLLSNAVTQDHAIRKQDVLKVFSYVVRSSQLGIQTALKFINDNLANIKKYIGDKTIENIFGTLTLHLTTEKLVEQYHNFLKNNSQHLSNISDSLYKYYEGAVDNLNWYKKYSPKILRWLETNYPK